MSVDVVVTAVVAAVTDEVPRVLVVRTPPGVDGDAHLPAITGVGSGEEALPFGSFDPAAHRTLQLGLRQLVAAQTGLELRWVEQLYTFGDRWRDPGELVGGPRVLSVAYLALTQEQPVAGSGSARWRDWYDAFPWEDWRAGRPALERAVIEPALRRWVLAPDDPAERARREERAQVAFGLGPARRDPERVLERYELLYEAGLVAEARRDRALRQRAGLGAGADRLAGSTTIAEAQTEEVLPGAAMALDDRRILATALGRLRGKLAWRPVVFDLLPPEFSLFRLQQTVEALAGVRLHKQNFRRMLAAGALVEPTGRVEHFGRGRPAELYRFRRDVLRAKPQAGMALPTVRASA